MKFSRRVQNLIADFRGIPRDYSTSFLKNEEKVGNLFQKILKKYIRTQDSQISSEILENWNLIVGNLFSKISAPYKVTPDGKLIVKVQNSVVRQELHFQKNEILSRIEHICPGNRISSIVFSL